MGKLMTTRVLTTQQLSQALRLHRKRRSLTQTDLARRSGVLPKTISALENNPGTCQINSLLRVLTALDLQLGLQSRNEGAAGAESDW